MTRTIARDCAFTREHWYAVDACLRAKREPAFALAEVGASNYG